MASLRSHFLAFFLVQIVLLLLSHPVKSNDDEEKLLQGINNYRASLNLPTLKDNNNAECFADEIADQLKKQPCTNTTGANTVPGTETQFSNYPDLAAKCHLDPTNTKDGAVMPVCVPNLVPSLVLSNFTKSQYSGSLNDSKYTGAGIGSESDWIVVVLTTNTPGGNFATDNNAAVLVSGVGLIYHLLALLLGSFLVLAS